MEKLENLKTILDELKFIGSSRNGTISNYQIEKNSLNQQVAKNLFNLNYIRICDIRKFPKLD